MEDNSIPVSGGKIDDKPEPAEIETTNIGQVETEILAEDGTDVTQNASTEDDVNLDDGEQVEGRVVLAVKVTRKQRTPTKRDSASQEEYAPRYEAPTRKPASKRPVSFNPLVWVADGVTGAIEEARHNDLGLSEDFWTHLYAVRRESLLTAQALVVSLIERVESKSDELEEREQRRERRGSVDIDF